MRCTVQELGRRLSASEFLEWQIMYAREGWYPQDARQRHAELLAATYNGPMTRHDRALWQPDHFLSAATVQQPAELDAEPDLEAHVRAHNLQRVLH